MIKFWRNNKKVTAEQEEHVWNHIDSLYRKLEEGKATKDEIKQIDDISKIIMATTQRKKVETTQQELENLTKRDLDMLTRTIGIEGVEKRFTSLTKQPNKKKNAQLSQGIKYAGVGIAASVLFALGISSYINDQIVNGSDARVCNVIQCQQDSVVHLIDGTIVYLAGGSDLIIAKDFGKKDRIVSLTGEAFFEVAKDKEKAFMVKTKEVNAIVHGTSFNVVAYNGSVESQVAVRTGCVEVASGKQSFGKFHRGDRVVYNKATHRSSHDTMNPDNIGVWKDGAFILEDATIEELKVRVKNRFHRELVIEKDAIPSDARINYCSYKLAQSEVDGVIKNICAIYGTRYEISESRIVISR